MKKLLSFCLALLLIAGLAVIPTGAANETIAPDTALWYGEGDAERFELTCAADFLGFFKKVSEGVDFAGKTVVLTADIDLNPGWDAGTGAAANVLTSLSTAVSFAGTFDGQGHTVSGLYARTSADHDTGIFGSASAGDDVTIRNVRFLNSCVDLTPKWRCTALMNTAGGRLTIENVYSEMLVIGKNNTGSFGSAFTANMNAGSVTVIRNSVFAGKITSASTCGAFIGRNDGTATLENCAFYGVLDDSTNKMCSGLADDNRGTLTVKNCISAGSVTANSGGNIHSVIRNAAGTYTAENNLYTEAATSAASQKGGRRIGEAELTGFYAWAEANSDAGFSGWDVIADRPYPTLLAWSAKGANSDTVCLKNWQKGQVESGVWGIRLIGGVDSLDYDALEIRLNIRNTAGKTGAVTQRVTTVWSSILADGTTYTAEELESTWIWGVTLGGIPENETAVDLDAAVYTVRNGVRTLVSVHTILVGGAER